MNKNENTKESPTVISEKPGQVLALETMDKHIIKVASGAIAYYEGNRIILTALPKKRLFRSVNNDPVSIRINKDKNVKLKLNDTFQLTETITMKLIEIHPAGFFSTGSGYIKLQHILSD